MHKYLLSLYPFPCLGRVYTQTFLSVCHTSADQLAIHCYKQTKNGNNNEIHTIKIYTSLVKNNDNENDSAHFGMV